MTIQIILQTCFMLCELLLIQSAPKIGYVLFDPLSDEANEVVKKNELRSPQDKIEQMQQNGQNPKEENKKPCHGYDYNESQCKYVNNRLLCGYDKNIAENKNDGEIIDLGNGCRIRGDRVECGYVDGPFNLPRRPPADFTSNAQQSKRSISNEKEEEIAVRLKLNAIKTTFTNAKTNLTAVTKDTKSTSSSLTSVSTTLKKFTTSKPTTTTTQPTTKLTTESTTKLTTASTTKLITRSTTKLTTASTTSTIANTTTTKLITKLTNLSISTPSTPITTNTTRSTTITGKTTRKRAQRKCVEKQDRIVCYDINTNLNIEK